MKSPIWQKIVTMLCGWYWDLFNPSKASWENWYKHKRCFSWFRLVDDRFSFWENPGCVILNMSMTAHIIEVTCENIISFMFHAYIVSHCWNFFYDISESCGSRPLKRQLQYQEIRRVLSLISLLVLCCCRVGIYTMLFLSMSDSSSVSIQWWHSCWERLSD